MLVSVLVLLLNGVASAVDGPKCDLPEALDTTLGFTTGGDAEWFCQDVNSFHGGDAAKSGDVSHNQQSWMQTNVSGAGTVSFYWKVSSETGSDYLEFYIDGMLLEQISGSVDWQKLTYTITATDSHTFEWRYVKDATIDARDNCGWVDLVKWGPIVSTTACDLSEAIDVTLDFITGGSADWFCQDRISHDGVDAAQSGNISHNQQSRMLTMVDVNESSILSFDWKVSSEPINDYLEFYIDGAWQDEISGTVDWHKMVYIIPAGSHILEWRYTKDVEGSEGYDSGWVDQLAWEPSFKPEPPCNLSDVLDTTLVFTTGGVADWGCTYKTTYDSVDAAKSGETSDLEDSWLQTTVSGCGTISFFWKVSSEKNFDHLEFYIDGVMQDRISGLLVDWQQMTYAVITSGLHTLEWRYVKDGSDSFSNDCGWVDQVEWVSTKCGVPCDLPKALDSTLNFTTGGDADWFCQTTISHFGGDAARSGYISDDQESWLQTMVSDAGTVSFYWKVISETGGDYLEFYIDGLLLDQISGSVDWQKITYTITSKDLHTLEWRYVKDATVSANTDSGWVDNVQWEPTIEFLVPCDVSDALDTTLDFITGGSAVWFCQDANFFYDGDAAQSGDISDDQVSRIVTTVTVDEPVRLSFYWKVSSEANCDFLQFYMDGAWEAEISGDIDWDYVWYLLPAGTYTLEWRYVKDVGTNGLDDCGWVDKLELVPEKPL